MDSVDKFLGYWEGLPNTTKACIYMLIESAGIIDSGRAVLISTNAKTAKVLVDNELGTYTLGDRLVRVDKSLADYLLAEDINLSSDEWLEVHCVDITKLTKSMERVCQWIADNGYYSRRYRMVHGSTITAMVRRKIITINNSAPELCNINSVLLRILRIKKLIT